jgi:hypothetical protein
MYPRSPIPASEVEIHTNDRRETAQASSAHSYAVPSLLDAVSLTN